MVSARPVNTGQSRGTLRSGLPRAAAVVRGGGRTVPRRDLRRREGARRVAPWARAARTGSGALRPRSIAGEWTNMQG